MKLVLKFVLLISFIYSLPTLLPAQDTSINQEFKEKAIQKLSELMNKHYVFPEVAKKTEAHLNEQWKSGHFKQFETLETFAEALTESVQTINKDKHMRIRPNRPYKAKENTPERMIEERLNAINFRRSAVAGFHAAKKLEGNVGYLDLRGFAGIGSGGPTADTYMKLLATSDALIIDLRKNGGGSPDMVQYLCSYFFDQKVHLNSLYWREGDVTREYWTLDEVNGKKMPDVPLFILTSNHTFSAAEEFSYNMQTRKRATLIGQTTGGGANPGGAFPLNAKLGVFIPTGRAINPITKTNWEGVGVIPEVPTAPEETMDKAHELAKAAAETYRSKNDEKYRKLMMGLNKTIEAYTPASPDKSMLQSLKACLKTDLIGEGDINALGYDYLVGRKKPAVAEAIFQANTVLFPKSANVYDSYAESLAANGKLADALSNYKKAVSLAKENDDPSLEIFMDNVKQVKKKLEHKK